MNSRHNACLKLILPGAVKDQVLDRLLEHPEWVGPFSTHDVYGHGAPHHIASAAEQVRGRAHRVQIEILMEQEHAMQLIGLLHAELGNAEIAWWLSPVIASGDFA